MPKLVASAIRFKPKDSDYFQIMCGKRHCNVLELMFRHQLEYDKLSAIQGFITDENRFVDRYEAFHIAREANQLLSEAKEAYKNKEVVSLFSEDVW